LGFVQEGAVENKGVFFLFLFLNKDRLSTFVSRSLGMTPKEQLACLIRIAISDQAQEKEVARFPGWRVCAFFYFYFLRETSREGKGESEA